MRTRPSFIIMIKTMLRAPHHGWQFEKRMVKRICPCSASALQLNGIHHDSMHGRTMLPVQYCMGSFALAVTNFLDTLRPYSRKQVNIRITRLSIKSFEKRVMICCLGWAPGGRETTRGRPSSLRIDETWIRTQSLRNKLRMSLFHILQ